MATIYKILSPCLNECYVGSTTRDVEMRWNEHIKRANNETTSHILFEKYGSDNCKFAVMEVCSLEERFIKEQWWLEHSTGAVNDKSAIMTPEERLAYKKAYNEEHREEIVAYMKAYHAANREKRCAYNEANREAKTAYNKAYSAANREKINAQARARHAAKKSE